MTAPIYNYLKYTRAVNVKIDASLFAVGAMLFQLNKENVEHPAVYCSKTLNSHKKNYTVTEKNCLAVIYTCKKIEFAFLVLDFLYSWTMHC